MQNNTFSTLFVGQNLIKLSAVDSTNNFLKELLSKSEPLPEGTVIMAENQFSGRGQQNNTWHTEPGKNLTVSFLLKPSFLELKNQFFLNMSVSIAIYNVLSKFWPNGFSIKWPNDIYFNDQKVGGILIENIVVGGTIKNTIVGVGLNVNQMLFLPELQNKATSLQLIMQKEIDLHQLLGAICKEIEGQYLQLKAKKHSQLKHNYTTKLYQIEKASKYRQNGEVFEGTIKGTTDSGLLLLENQGVIKEYNLKEIEFLNPIK